MAPFEISCFRTVDCLDGFVHNIRRPCCEMPFDRKFVLSACLRPSLYSRWAMHRPLLWCHVAEVNHRYLPVLSSSVASGWPARLLSSVGRICFLMISLFPLRLCPQVICQIKHRDWFCMIGGSSELSSETLLSINSEVVLATDISDAVASFICQYLTFFSCTVDWEQGMVPTQTILGIS